MSSEEQTALDIKKKEYLANLVSQYKNQYYKESPVENESENNTPISEVSETRRSLSTRQSRMFFKPEFVPKHKPRLVNVNPQSQDRLEKARSKVRRHAMQKRFNESIK